MDVFNCIKTRRSVRSYSDLPIGQADINKLIESAIWAPSGKNGQPWMFKIVSKKEDINALSNMSIYKKWVSTASCFILVFLNKGKSYDYIKDIQSCGAAIQNILLCAHSLGIGSCWIGEVIDKSEEIKNDFRVDDKNLELMGVISLGYKSDKAKKIIVKRNDIKSFML